MMLKMNTIKVIRINRALHPKWKAIKPEKVDIKTRPKAEAVLKILNCVVLKGGRLNSEVIVMNVADVSPEIREVIPIIIKWTVLEFSKAIKNKKLKVDKACNSNTI